MPTSSGPISLPGNPTAPLHAATKAYVDAPTAPRTMSATTAASVDATVAGDMQITATGDTVITPNGTPNGRQLIVEVLASGGQRVPSVAASVFLTNGINTRSLTVPTGMVGLFGLRYSSLLGAWMLTAATLTVTTDVTAPAVPTGLGATAGNAQVTLDWADNTDPDLVGYDYRFGTTNPPAGSPVRVTASAIIITGLTNGTPYFFQVRAVDTSSNASAYTASVTATPAGSATVPGAPTGVSAAAGNAQASVSWSAPASDGGAAITDYVVQSSLDSGTTWVTFADGTSTATNATVTGLTNGTAYVFRTAAVNSVGTGTYSSASSAVTPTSGTTVPGAPTAVTGTPGNTQVALSWTAPASNGGAAITDYVVQSSLDSGTTWVTFADGTSTATTATVTGLTNGTSYVFRVAAVNSVGQGTYSTTSAASTPATVPGAPTSVTGTAGNGQVPLSWTAPASNGGSAITDYLVQYSSNSGSTWTTFADGTSTATTATVTGLTNGTAYIFQVAAVNTAGTGAYSTASSTVTPAAGTTITDAFTGTAGATLASRTAGWSTGNTDFVISPSGTTAQKSSTTSSALFALVGPLSTSNHEASIVIVSRGGASNIGAVARANSSGTDFYAVRTVATNVISIQKSVAGTATILLDNIATFAAGDRLGIKCVGDQIQAKQNGTVIATITDTSITTGTYAGIRAGGNATQATLDDFSAADT